MRIFQLKAARIAAHLTQKELGDLLSIPQSTLSFIEFNNDKLDYIPWDDDRARRLENFFAQCGIRFPDTNTITLLEDPAIILENTKK